MLTQTIHDFLEYFDNVDFKERSLDAASLRLKQFENFCQTKNIKHIKDISYADLLTFITEFGYCSIHVKKSRVWALHQFFHFLTLKQIITQNIALKLPYPKIEKKIPPFLTCDEYNKILKYFAQKADKPSGLRNLIIVMIMGLLGFRTSTIVRINIEHFDLKNKTIWIQEKGTNTKRALPIPDILSHCLQQYIKIHPQKQGALFLSKRNKRISDRTLQQLFRDAAQQLGIDKKLHPHLFRHTAATYLNKIAGTSITQFVLGHARRANTEKYAHLNPDVYATYMKRHPYMNN